jgi:hypothetical protein
MGACPVSLEEKHYGHGYWPRGQVFAIVATYRRKGWSDSAIASKLGLTRKFVAQIGRYVDDGSE